MVVRRPFSQASVSFESDIPSSISGLLSVLRAEKPLEMLTWQVSLGTSICNLSIAAGSGSEEVLYKQMRMSRQPRRVVATSVCLSVEFNVTILPLSLLDSATAAHRSCQFKLSNKTFCTDQSAHSNFPSSSNLCHHGRNNDTLFQQTHGEIILDCISFCC